jgi:hypothetical protein
MQKAKNANFEDELVGRINLEVADFFGVKPLKYKLVIFNSIDDLAESWLSHNNDKHSHAPSWLVAFADFNNTIYLLSPDIMPAGAEPNGRLRFNKTIKHELSHNYIRNINKNIPSWLNEGVCLYVASQNHYKSMDLDKIRISLLDELHRTFVDGRIYQVGKTIVDQIVNNFGKQKLLKIISIQDKNELYDKLKQMFVWLE